MKIWLWAYFLVPSNMQTTAFQNFDFLRGGPIWPSFLYVFPPVELPYDFCDDWHVAYMVQC